MSSKEIQLIPRSPPSRRYTKPHVKFGCLPCPCAWTSIRISYMWSFIRILLLYLYLRQESYGCTASLLISLILHYLNLCLLPKSFCPPQYPWNYSCSQSSPNKEQSTTSCNGEIGAGVPVFALPALQIFWTAKGQMRDNLTNEKRRGEMPDCGSVGYKIGNAVYWMFVPGGAYGNQHKPPINHSTGIS